MKQMLWGGAAAAAAACVYALAAEPTAPPKTQGQAQPIPWASVLGTNTLLLVSPGGAAPKPLSPIPARAVVAIQGLPSTNGFFLPGVAPLNPAGSYALGRSNLFVLPSGGGAPAPGVYRTAPYSCLVLVPGPMRDDKCMVDSGGGRSSMPTIRPELQFLPWSPNR